MNRLIKRVVPLYCITLVLAGCVTNSPRDNRYEYAPSYPVAQQIPQDSSGSIYKSGFGIRLFEDTKAHRVGDLLTVVLIENTSAQKSASTSSSKGQNIDFPTPIIMGAPVTLRGREILNNEVDMGNDFSGDGSSSQSNSLKGSLTVFVSHVLPNGNMVIRGEKKLTLNQGDEYLRLTGIVRPVDVRPDNTVDSSKVANAEIFYSGDGSINDANRMGWMARFFNGPLWPF
ncbi:MAG: flagellar basal body L-ring protein FlgH [Chromatiales bacterium]|nr:flagellar basal body L-ring protein FlgH [Chromatiales bacterium]